MGLIVPHFPFLLIGGGTRDRLSPAPSRDSTLPCHNLVVSCSLCIIVPFSSSSGRGTLFRKLAITVLTHNTLSQKIGFVQRATTTERPMTTRNGNCSYREVRQRETVPKFSDRHIFAESRIFDWAVDCCAVAGFRGRGNDAFP